MAGASAKAGSCLKADLWERDGWPDGREAQRYLGCGRWLLAAGHDRYIIPIRRENLDALLNPDPWNLAAKSAILDDRERPYYEHRIAA